MRGIESFGVDSQNSICEYCIVVVQYISPLAYYIWVRVGQWHVEWPPIVPIASVLSPYFFFNGVVKCSIQFNRVWGQIKPFWSLHVTRLIIDYCFWGCSRSNRIAREAPAAEPWCPSFTSIVHEAPCCGHLHGLSLLSMYAHVAGRCLHSSSGDSCSCFRGELQLHGRTVVDYMYSMPSLPLP